MTMFSEIRLAIRLLGRRRGVALGAVCSLALGIGANTAIFSVLHRVVINPLPYRAPEELVVIWETSADNPERWVAPANYVDWRREARSFASLAAFDEFRPTLTRPLAGSAAEAEVVRAVSASGHFFTTLGVSAGVGRSLVPADDKAGAPRVAVLSDGLWRRAFAARPEAVGEVALLNGEPHTIVGVMPERMASPLQSAPIDLWVNGDRGVPRTFPFGGDITTVRDAHMIYVLGRLAPGVTTGVAQQELSAVMQDLSRRYPNTNAGLGVNVQPLHAAVVGDVSRLVGLLQLAVATLLLVACANVAHLLLGQAIARHTEMATRVALGAGRGRLLRQLSVETLAVAVPGGALGLLVAVGALRALVAAAPQGLPRLDEIGIDLTVLGFTTVVTIATAVLFGLGPAWRVSRNASLAPVASTRVSGGRAARRWHHAIMFVEIAGAQVLLIGAGLLIASLMAAQRVPLGFEPAGRAAAELTLAPERYLQPASEAERGERTIAVAPRQQFVERVLARVAHTPGLRAAAASFTAPLAGAPNRGLAIAGRPAPLSGAEHTADFQAVTPDFFRTVGATLVRGRHFTAQDTAAAAPVTIVNQAFAERYLAGVDPLGQRVQFGGDLTHQIVGVVGDMRYRAIETAAEPAFYVPLAQNAERWPFLSFSVWTEGDAGAASAALRSAIREADTAQAVLRVRTYEEIVGRGLAARRFTTTLVAAFAVTALLLAAIGTYGIVSLGVSMRTRELGVRAALGATPRDLIWLVLQSGAVTTAAAIAVGGGASLLAAGWLQALVFGVTPRDPATFAVVSATLAAVALVATWLPTRRVSTADPVRALTQSSSPTR